LNVAVGIQCRLGSQRLPCKALLKLSDTTILGMTIKRSIAQNFDTFLLTSEDESDDLILKEGKENNVKKVIRGSLLDVSSRYLNLIDEVKPDFVVRVTADNPLTEFRYINPLIEHMIRTDLPYSWVDPYSCADGVNLEIFTSEFFKLSYESDKSKFCREHVTSYMRSQVGLRSSVKLYELLKITPQNSSNLHFGIDNIEDYVKMNKIINFTESKGIRWFDDQFTYECISNAKNQAINYPQGRRHFP